LFKNFFGTEEMRQIFSVENLVSHSLGVEVALAKVEAGLGLIPAQAYEEIARRASGLSINWERMRVDVEGVGYPVLPLLHQLGEACGGASEYLHWGSTTRDVTDTAFVLQMREALAVMQRDARRVRTVLLGMTEAYQSTVMVARTNGMHALPTTFGFRCAIWLSELDRQIDRLERVRDDLVAGPFGGAVGTLAALGPRGLEVQGALMMELGMGAPPLGWLASRDRISEVVFTLATVATSMAGIAETIVAMTRNEVQELREPTPPNRRGMGSGLHHKHNTVGCELVMAHARLVAQNVSVVMGSMLQDYERDWQGHCESVVVPQSFELAHAAVSQMAVILAGLEVFPGRMRINIDITRGLVMAESVMTRLARKSGRRTAHRLVSRACEAAERDDCSLREALLRTKDVMCRFTIEELDEALDPANYLGCGPQIVAQIIVAAHARTGTDG
jgi:3-carboxy-cis,cis-muconate cycloisomerase